MRRVALIYDATNAYDLKVMSGIAMYIQQHSGWEVYIEPLSLTDQRLPDLTSWRGDGVIADFDQKNVADAVLHSRLPAIAFGGGYGWYPTHSSIPYFYNNQTMIAELAADHLLKRGFRHFAYCGYPRNSINGWSRDRELAFVRRVGEHGCKCAVYNGRYETRTHWSSVQRGLGHWLSSLPKPLGLMGADDNRARHVLEACKAIKLRVPEVIAVIGVDNDELICKISTPLLSSIEQGAKRIGFEAAALLDQLMERSEKPTPVSTRYIVDPVEVIGRQSTETLAADDQKVSAAIRYIAQHLAAGLKVSDVVEAIAVSRSGLERRFKQELGMTVHSAIRQSRLDRTKQLIYDTNLPLKQIASDIGFASVQQMTTLFGKAFGQSPAKYRRIRTSQLS